MSDGAMMCPGCAACRCGRKEHDAAEVAALRAEREAAVLQMREMEVLLDAARTEGDSLAARLAEAVGVVSHQVYRNHTYHPAGCSDCERAARVLAAGEGR